MSAWMGHARSRMPRLAEQAVERARLTVVPRRSRAPRVPFVVLVFLVLLGGVVGLLMFNTHMQQMSFTATELQARADRLHATQQSLQMELDELRDPQRVATRAQALGMVPMVSPAFLRLSDGKQLGEAKTATPMDAQRLEPIPTQEPPGFKPRRTGGVVDETPDMNDDGVPSDDLPSERDTTG
ncbi:cell division protein FtsL [Nocardioides caldifontis]|uniref:cell division protein FtsL n=1 Tax=Nocardioides caldifontis TaxID=2588938 RepID=UPI0011DF12A2|nr:cell division protein FtsL [Nocardioides caldifontis]